MQLHELKPTYKLRKKKRVGRGGKRGTYSGRGLKGQKARAGRKLKPIIRELIKRYPKLRGYRYAGYIKNSVILNLDVLEKKFEAGQIVNPQSLRKAGIIRNIKGKEPEIKILCKGQLKKPLIIENCQLSKKARAEIEKAGGTVKSI